MGQPSMPEKRDSSQLPHGEPGDQGVMQRVIAGIQRLRSTGVRKWQLLFPAALTLPVAVAIGLPHSIVPAIASIIVAGLASMIGKYLFYYAKNTRADSIAEVRRAAIERKITASDAEKLIRADMPEPDSSRQHEGDETAGRRIGL